MSLHLPILLPDGILQFPELHSQYLSRVRQARQRCHGTCDDGALLREFTGKVRERQRSLAGKPKRP